MAIAYEKVNNKSSMDKATVQITALDASVSKINVDLDALPSDVRDAAKVKYASQRERALARLETAKVNAGKLAGSR
jgi:hypothetical protein